MAGFSREVARRVFAGELRGSNLAFREGDDQQQYAPQYLLTPTGARCNRVFLVGTLTERDDIGGDTEYWRGRVVDPTGSVLVYAGQYQPEAARVLAGLEPPAFVAVVGKPSLFETEDGKVLLSVRAEAVQEVDEVTRDIWVLETARKTLARVKAMEALGMPGGDFVTADVAAGPRGPEEDDIERARMHYKTVPDEYRQMIQSALDTLLSEAKGEGFTPETEMGSKVSGEAAGADLPTRRGGKARARRQEVLEDVGLEELGDTENNGTDTVEEFSFAGKETKE